MDPTKTASIGAQLNPDVDAALREFLRENWDIFAWHPSDMPGIPRRLAEHSLNILKGFKPVKQTLQRFSEPKRQAMGEELAKLLEAGFDGRRCSKSIPARELGHFRLAPFGYARNPTQIGRTQP